MNGRDLKAVFITLGLLAVGAILIVVVAPNFFANEKLYPEKTPTIITQQNSPTTVNTTKAPAPVVSNAPTAIPATTTPLPPTATVVKPTVTALPSSTTPQITEQPFSLPRGLEPSEGAKSCPKPLPVEQIRADYLAHWKAFQQAYREGNPAILKPFVDTQARDGKYWQGMQQAIEETVKGGYYLDYQIEHSNPLVVKINPTFGGAGQCQVSVFDSPKLTITAKKQGTDAPFNKDNSKTYIQQYKANQTFEMVVKNGRWVLAGAGAGSQ